MIFMLIFPGGIPTDGPSAGIAIATAIYSALKNIPVHNKVAMTGELSVRGYVKPVGGVITKLMPPDQAGVERVFIPKENWQSLFAEMRDIEIIPVEKLEEVLAQALINPQSTTAQKSSSPQVVLPSTADNLLQKVILPVFDLLFFQ